MLFSPAHAIIPKSIVTVYATLHLSFDFFLYFGQSAAKTSNARGGKRHADMEIAISQSV